MIPRGIVLKDLPKSLNQILNKRQLTRTSQGPRQEKKHYRLWAMPGDFVNEKDILARQYTMLWHPGLNAGINHDRTIYALCEGIMIVTEEPYEPDWKNSLVREIYMKGEQKLPPPYARYLHVIPKRRIGEYKLIDEV